MIDRADKRLEQWVQSLLPDLPVSFEAPKSDPDGSGVSLYLLELRHSHPVRGGRKPLLEFAASYLVTTWSEDARDGHKALADLLFAALQSSDFEICLDPPPPELWLALQTLPRPAFQLRVPLRLELERKRGAIVRQPIQVTYSALEPREGRLLGPGDIPLAGARVEFPQLKVAVATDADGRFRLAGVPLSAPPSQAKVRAKGQEFLVPLEGWGARGEPLTIRLEKLEV